MKVTNVTVKLASQSSDRLKAFCTMTLDDEFVVRDLKVIEGTSGLFVAMPSRKLTDHCPKCGGKNHLRAKFCNDCGAELPQDRAPDEEAQGKLHADVAHPINSECRNRLQGIILDAYREELRNAGRADEASGVVGDVGEAPAEEPAEPVEPPAEAPPPAPEAPPAAPEEPPAAPEEPSAPTAGEPPPEEEPSTPDKGAEEEGGEEQPPGKGHIFGEGIL